MKHELKVTVEVIHVGKWQLEAVSRLFDEVIYRESLKKIKQKPKMCKNIYVAYKIDFLWNWII